MARIIIFTFLILSVIACNRTKPVASDDRSSRVKYTNTHLQYAMGFTIEYFGACSYIVVFDPWQKNDTLASYLLQPKSDSTTACVKKADFVVKTPVEHVASLSSTFLGMFNLLGEGEKISASSDPQLICDSVLFNRYLNGNLLSIGQAMQVNLEAIIAQKPDLLMKYIYVSKEESDKQIEQAGIPIAYNLEFMETQPLGRAEWIKFVAAFLGQQELADSLFTVIANSYERLKALATAIPEKPTVLDGSSYKGIWYAAGGKSFPAQFYADAGADYYWKSDSSRGSLPLSLEIIIEKQADADFWIGPNTGNRKDLLNIEQRYSLLHSFKTNNVFHFDKRMNPNGGVDYYEGAVVRPDILLKDLIWVFHPQIIEANYETVYLARIR